MVVIAPAVMSTGAHTIFKRNGRKKIQKMKREAGEEKK
jgi:hypothetical protein